jgi:DNA-directed RNA polymerase subunit H (RpoH/RPB5)
MSDTRKIITLYNSRKTIIELLSTLKYDVNDYEGFSINEIDAMNKNEQLDMLISHKTTNTKIYVKYYLPDRQKQITKKVLDNIIEDLFVVENILKKEDTLIIIMDEEPNDSNIAKMNYLYDNNGYFIVMHNIKRLQFNITNHQLVPKMTILNETETKELMIIKNFSDLSQLPEISRYDPQALSMCLRPKQICKFERNSMTALKCIYYRVCL